MKALWFIILTFFVFGSCYILVPMRGEGVSDAIVGKNGEIAILIRVRKALLIEPFEESLYVRRAGLWYKYYVDHEASYWSSSRLILDGGSIQVIRGSTPVVLYDFDSGQYLKSGNALQPIGKYSFTDGFTLARAKQMSANRAQDVTP